jgi:hypothetical protein
MLLNAAAGLVLWMPLAAPVAGPGRLADLVAVEFETYLILDGRETLSGAIGPRPPAASKESILPALRGGLDIRLAPVSFAAPLAEPAIAVTAERLDKEIPAY